MSGPIGEVDSATILGIAGLYGLVLGWFHLRMNNVEDRDGEMERRVLARIEAGEREMRAKIDENHAVAQAHRERIAETMVTKADLENCERRLATLIDAKLGVQRGLDFSRGTTGD